MFAYAQAMDQRSGHEESQPSAGRRREDPGKQRNPDRVRLRDAERTKARILDAARKRFAEHGFDRTTIRAVAADAEIDPSMVMRYFTDKNTLFRAASYHAPQLPELTTVPVSQLGTAVARAFLRRWQDPSTLTLLRVAPTHQDIANQVHHAYRDQLTMLAAQVAPREEAQERASLVASQIVGLAMARHVLRLEPLHDMDEDSLVERIGPTLQHYLTGPLPPETGG